MISTKLTNLILITDNHYLYTGFRLGFYKNYHVHIYSVESLFGIDFEKQTLIIIDVESWERSSLGQTHSLNQLIKPFKYKYLLAKNSEFNINILQLIYNNTIVLSEKEMIHLLTQQKQNSNLSTSRAPKVNLFTSRELQTILLYTYGLEVETICDALGIKHKTFYHHISSALKKVGSKKYYQFHNSINPYYKDIILTIESIR